MFRSLPLLLALACLLSGCMTTTPRYSVPVISPCPEMPVALYLLIPSEESKPLYPGYHKDNP